MQEEKDFRNDRDEEQEIDLLELAKKLWDHRKKLIIWSVCGAVIGLVVAFSIPKEYAT
ncbi:MAG: chain-length determining protein, partial [Duncaniella sp.]|nr:chain-length determining protein [Duncaniella sp.]